MDRSNTQRRLDYLALILASLSLSANASAAPASSVVGEAYERGCVYRGIFGEGYRDLWTSPIEVEVLRLGEAGLRPVDQVGSMQTLGLALVDERGRSHTFRSLDKDASRLLPFWMRLPPWPGIFKDQTSAGFPGAPLVVGRFAQAIGSLETPARLVLLADDESLGAFRETFAGLVGTLREYPTAGDGADRSGTFGATEVLSTAALFERSVRTGVDRAGARAYLRVRLLDLWVGDWDRHPEQFRWARVPGSELWQPLPEDRDGAFARYDGPLVHLLGIDRLVFFDHDYPDDDGLFLQARNLDAWILGSLDRSAWEEEIEFVRSRLNQKVIDEAIARLPEGWQNLRGDFLRELLSKRLESLPEQALRLYAQLARETRWIGSGQKETWRATCRGDGSLSLELGLDRASKPYARRVFWPDETSRMEIWTLGGEDTVEIFDPNHCQMDLDSRRPAQGDRLPRTLRGVPNWN